MSGKWRGFKVSVGARWARFVSGARLAQAALARETADISWPGTLWDGARFLFVCIVVGVAVGFALVDAIVMAGAWLDGGWEALMTPEQFAQLDFIAFMHRWYEIKVAFGILSVMLAVILALPYWPRPRFRSERRQRAVPLRSVAGVASGRRRP